jgi:hypothetical protein
MHLSRIVRKRLLSIATLCAGGLTAYLLSVGPAVFIYERFNLVSHPAGEALELFYDPLLSYTREGEGDYPAKVLESYIDLWSE